MSIKEELICNRCKIILEEPVSLPCGCFICNDHITQQLKKNKEIKCISCNKIHQIPLEGFRVNKMAKKLIEQKKKSNKKNNSNTQFKASLAF